MLAYQLINDLHIFCSNSGCEWKGPLDEITIHLPNCTFGQGKLPDWFVRYLLSREEEFQREQHEEEMLSDDVRTKINAEKAQPLAMRVFAKNDEQGNSRLANMLGYNEEKENEVKKGKKVLNKKSITNENMLKEIYQMTVNFDAISASQNDSDSGIGLEDPFMGLNQSGNKKEVDIQNIVDKGFDREKVKEVYDVFEDAEQTLEFLLDS